MPFALSLSSTRFFQEPGEAGQTGWDLMIQNHRNVSLPFCGAARTEDSKVMEILLTNSENYLLIYEIVSCSFGFLKFQCVLGGREGPHTNKQFSDTSRVPYY